jgi:hypothetical protein
MQKQHERFFLNRHFFQFKLQEGTCFTSYTQFSLLLTDEDTKAFKIGLGQTESYHLYGESKFLVKYFRHYQVLRRDEHLRRSIQQQSHRCRCIDAPRVDSNLTTQQKG